MSETKWTPGPWWFDSYNTIFSGTGENAKEICSIPDHPQDGSYRPEEISERSAWYAESCANARLIEVAPRMREALKLYLSTYSETDHHPTAVEEARCMNAARAALAPLG